MHFGVNVSGTKSITFQNNNNHDNTAGVALNTAIFLISRRREKSGVQALNFMTSSLDFKAKSDSKTATQAQ